MSLTAEIFSLYGLIGVLNFRSIGRWLNHSGKEPYQPNSTRLNLAAFCFLFVLLLAGSMLFWPIHVGRALRDRSVGTEHNFEKTWLRMLGDKKAMLVFQEAEIERQERRIEQLERETCVVSETSVGSYW